MSVPGPPVIRPRPRVTSNSLELWWEPPISDGGSPITGYDLQAPGVYYHTPGPTDGYQNIEGYLSLYTPYTFQIAAINANGTGPYAYFRTVQLGYSPDEPNGAEVTRDASGVATFTWTNPAYTGGIPLGWNVVTAFPIDASGSTVKWNTFGTYEQLRLGAGNPTAGQLNPEKTYVGLIQGRNDVSFAPRSTFTAPITFGWLPTDVSGMTLWLDAADANTLFQNAAGTQSVGLRLNGQPVKAWHDKSGSGFHLYQSGVRTESPKLSLYGLNSTYPGVSFSQLTHALDSSNNIILFPYNRGTVFSVVQQIPVEPINVVLYSGQVGLSYDGARGSGRYLLDMDGSSQTEFISTGNAQQFIAYADLVINHFQRINPNTSPETNFRQGNTLATSSVFTLGPEGANTYSFAISELLCYDRDLALLERYHINTYLARKWGLPLPTAPDTTFLLYLRGSTMLVAPSYWPDSSPYTRPGITIQNGAAALDGSGIAVVLDGSSNWVVPTLGSHNAFTVNVWYKDLGTAATESPCIITEQFSSSPINYAITRGQQGQTAGKWACGFFSTTTSWNFGTEFDLSGNEWLNIQFTWDGTDIKTYINGSLIGTVNHSGSTASSSGLPIRLGRRWDNPEYMTGLLGEVRIYSRTLNGTEVLADYNASASIFL